MAIEKIPTQVLARINEVVLSAVTSAADSSSVDVDTFQAVSVWVAVTGNTGAVTVTIEASPSGLFTGEEVAIDAKTYTATNGTDKFSYFGEDLNYVRVTTGTQSSSTVTATITARS